MKKSLMFILIIILLFMCYNNVFAGGPYLDYTSYYVAMAASGLLLVVGGASLSEYIDYVNIYRIQERVSKQIIIYKKDYTSNNDYRYYRKLNNNRFIVIDKDGIEKEMHYSEVSCIIDVATDSILYCDIYALEKIWFGVSINSLSLLYIAYGYPVVDVAGAVPISKNTELGLRFVGDSGSSYLSLNGVMFRHLSYYSSGVIYFRGLDFFYRYYLKDATRGFFIQPTLLFNSYYVSLWSGYKIIETGVLLSLGYKWVFQPFHISLELGYGGSLQLFSSDYTPSVFADRKTDHLVNLKIDVGIQFGQKKKIVEYLDGYK